jgi:hypothetical protein
MTLYISLCCSTFVNLCKLNGVVVSTLKNGKWIFFIIALGDLVSNLKKKIIYTIDNIPTIEINFVTTQCSIFHLQSSNSIGSFLNLSLRFL